MLRCLAARRPREPARSVRSSVAQWLHTPRACARRVCSGAGWRRDARRDARRESPRIAPPRRTSAPPRRTHATPRRADAQHRRRTWAQAAQEKSSVALAARGSGEGGGALWQPRRRRHGWPRRRRRRRERAAERGVQALEAGASTPARRGARGTRRPRGRAQPVQPPSAAVPGAGGDGARDGVDGVDGRRARRASEVARSSTSAGPGASSSRRKRGGSATVRSAVSAVGRLRVSARHALPPDLGGCRASDTPQSNPTLTKHRTGTEGTVTNPPVLSQSSTSSGTVAVARPRRPVV